jgi:uncharacterized protein with HEPN domain
VRTTRLLLQDVLDAIEVIERYTPATPEAFAADPPVQSHVLRHIAIIGEVAARLPQPLRDANPTVPWRQIIAMRNILVHVYHGINWDRVYETARRDIPVLKPAVEAMLAVLPPDPTTADPTS